ncbi:MAG: diguanylate cyclase domain-containing protein [Huintestinicola sp.]
MKIRIKLCIALISLTLISTLAISLFSISEFESYAKEKAYDETLSNQTIRTEELSSFFQGIISSQKDTASLMFIRDFLELANDSGISDYSTIEGIDKVNEEITSIKRNLSYVSDVYLINAEGIIVASSDTSFIGKKLQGYNDIVSGITAYNGIGEICTDNQGKSYTTVSRRIFSSNNAKIGILYEKIDLSKITDIINTPNPASHVDVIVIDHSGNILNGSDRSISTLEKHQTYRDLAPMLTPVSVALSGGGTEESIITEYSSGVDRYQIFGNQVKTGQWCLASISSGRILDSSISDSVKPIKIFSSVIFIPLTAGVILVIIWFTAPIQRITQLLYQKSKGNNTVKLDIKTNDEFGEISDSFNTLFDNIYESEQRYRTVVSMIDNTIFEVNLKTNKIYVSDNFNKKFDFRSADDSVTSSFLFKIKVYKDDSSTFSKDVDAILSNKEQWRGEYRIRNKYGDFTWFRIIAKKFNDNSGAPSKIIGLISDIDKEKKSEINLIQKACFDALTRLYNRETFMRILEAEMDKSAERKSLDAFLFVDLDNFKHFNDEYGHACGDEVLKFVADSIKEITYGRGFGGRIGGDEFVFCLTQLTLIGDAGKAAGELIDVLDRGFDSESTGLHLNIHCSIGIAFFRENGDSPSELKESADAAMYEIKKNGKSNFGYSQNVNVESSSLPSDISDVLDKPLEAQYSANGSDSNIW